MSEQAPACPDHSFIGDGRDPYPLVDEAPNFPLGLADCSARAYRNGSGAGWNRVYEQTPFGK